jgi:hypothetical protein
VDTLRIARTAKNVKFASGRLQARVHRLEFAVTYQPLIEVLAFGPPSGGWYGGGVRGLSVSGEGLPQTKARERA